MSTAKLLGFQEHLDHADYDEFMRQVEEFVELANRSAERQKTELDKTLNRLGRSTY